MLTSVAGEGNPDWMTRSARFRWDPASSVEHLGLVDRRIERVADGEGLVVFKQLLLRLG